MSFEVVRVQTDGFLVVMAGVLVIEERAVSASQVEGGAAVSGIGGEGSLEELYCLLILLLAAFEVMLHAVVEQVNGGLVAPAGNQDADTDGRLLSGIDHLLARPVGLVAHLHALYGVL